jgi:hypothetical protein
MDMKKLTTLIIGIVLIASMSAMANKEESTTKTDKEAEASPMVLNSIIGKVVDLTTGESLAGVKVTVDGTEMVAFTDFDGNFKFSNINLKEAKLCASFISYEKASMEINNLNGNVKLTMKSAY